MPINGETDRDWSNCRRRTLEHDKAEAAQAALPSLLTGSRLDEKRRRPRPVVPDIFVSPGVRGARPHTEDHRASSAVTGPRRWEER